MKTIDAIFTRRSIRRFKKDPIDTETILKILDAARMAPSGANLQPWYFIVIRDRKILEEMEKIIRNEMEKVPKFLKGTVKNREELLKQLRIQVTLNSLFFVQAPVTIAVCVQEIENPLMQCLLDSGMDSYDVHKYMGFMEIQSVSAAVQNLLLATHDLGYGACWMNVPFFAKDELEKILGVKSPWSLISLIPIGKPDHSPMAPPRKSIEDISTFLG